MKKWLLSAFFLILLSEQYGQITSFPYHQDFELLSPSVLDCNTQEALADLWENGSSNTIDWLINSGLTPTPQTGPSQDAIPGSSQGRYLYIETDPSCVTGRLEASLLSPIFDLTALATPVLELQYHLYGKGQGSLHLDMQIGSQWQNDIIPPLHDNLDRWQRLSKCLIGIAGERHVRFRLRGITGLSNTSDMAIDGFVLREAASEDIYVQAILNTHCGLGLDESIRCRYGNLGSDDATEVVLSYAVDGGAYVSQDTVRDTLRTCETQTHTFSRLADLSGSGSHQLSVAVSWRGHSDDASYNDTLSIELHYIPEVTKFPYEEDFEQGAGGWQAGGERISWQLGQPAATGINTAGSGQNAWVTNLNGSYNSLEYSYIESPCFDFSSFATDPVIHFMHTYKLESGTLADYCWLEYSIDDGKNWQALGSMGSGFENWYNSNLDHWTGLSAAGLGQWQQAAHSLSGLAGQKAHLRFVLRTDNTIRMEGVGIDRIRISYPHDVKIISLEAPKDTCAGNLSRTETVRIRLENQGYFPTQGVDLAFVVDGGAIQSREPLSYTLQAFESTVFTFSGTANLAALGAHHVEGIAFLNSDNNLNNNRLLKRAGNFLPTRFSLGADTLICAREELLIGTLIPALKYSWSNGDSLPLILAANGLYRLDIIDLNGCESFSEIQLRTTPSIVATQQILQMERCYGTQDGSIQVIPSGGMGGGFRIHWQSGSPDFIQSRVRSGTYPFVLEDSMGCLFEDRFVFQGPDSMTFYEDEVRNAGCPQDSSGAVLLTPQGGTQPYTYQWSDGSSNQDLVQINGGTYYLDILDDNGCTYQSRDYVIDNSDTLPHANFSYQVSGGTVNFTSHSANAVTNTWDFGDEGRDTTSNRSGGDVNPIYTYGENGTYTIVLIASNSCGSDTVIITINLLNVGIKKPLLLNSVKVFPNPATDEVYVYFGDKELNNIKFQILDIVGHEVYFAKYARLSAKHKESLDISSRLKPGTYIVRVAAQEGVSTVKLVVR